MPDPRVAIEEAVATYDRAAEKGFAAAAERERKEMLDRFPLDQWPTMPLERYALGQKILRRPLAAGWNSARNISGVCGAVRLASTSSTNTRTDLAGTSTHSTRTSGRHGSKSARRLSKRFKMRVQVIGTPLTI
jgi:hypothetical protein